MILAILTANDAASADPTQREAPWLTIRVGMSKGFYEVFSLRLENCCIGSLIVVLLCFTLYMYGEAKSAADRTIK